jgi:phosphoglycolate phosphatase
VGFNVGILCNICGSTDFKVFGDRPRDNALCIKCNSLERHRALNYFLKANGFLENRLGVSRCLQLAPEEVTHEYLIKAYGSGFITADLFPQRYEHAQCLKLHLPEGFEIFPDGYFDLIVHNHVLEHIPGSFRSHIDEFHRLLAKDGVMAFTIPDYRITIGVKDTVEGGENLATDEDRLREHGLEDHYKSFGTDLIDYLQKKFTKFEALLMENSDLKQKLRDDHNAQEIVFWCVR